MSNEKDSTNKPSRAYELVLYPDDTIHAEYIDLLLKDKRCVGAFHNYDTDDNGELKKEHFHILIKFDNPTTIGSVLKICPNLKQNYIKYVKSFKGACRYLKHLDNPEKYQYSDDNIYGNKAIAKRYWYTEDCEIYGIQKIIDYINSCGNNIISLKDLLTWSCENDCYSQLRRNSYMLCKIVEDHNKTAPKKWIDELYNDLDERNKY